MNNKYVCIHGHFYQPPRENPWLNKVEMQDSAYPYHDWNHRITAECYARNTASRFLDGKGRIIQIVNNYSRISFNFGPTLLEWMEKNSPDVYDGILQADKESQKRFSGHGSALAQVYNHMIMPLASDKDKQTQVKWGISDFQKRFGRFPEGMWLGETAVDTATLEILAENGIKFTILSPYQAKRVRPLLEEEPKEETNSVKEQEETGETENKSGTEKEKKVAPLASEEKLGHASSGKSTDSPLQQEETPGKAHEKEVIPGDIITEQQQTSDNQGGKTTEENTPTEDPEKIPATQATYSEAITKQVSSTAKKGPEVAQLEEEQVDQIKETEQLDSPLEEQETDNDEKVPKDSQEDQWADVVGGKVDPRNAYLCKLPSGRTITLFFYDGPISQGIAFERLLDNGELFAQRLLDQVKNGEGDPKMINIATDGETYGHHHRFGEMGLSYCLHVIQNSDQADLTIYGEYLEKHPPQYEVEIIENTSWSCYHGVERWRSNCGCNTGGREGWNQEWRAPLRNAFDYLRDNIEPLFEKEMKALVDDPWRARDNYINVILDRSPENVDLFFKEHTIKYLKPDEQVSVLKLLEMQYHAMLMYTSCGWFFDEVTGIESMQDILYAARAIQLAREVTGKNFEPGFLKILEQAKSNIPEFKDAAHAYQKFVKPAVVDLHRVGAHYAVSSIFSEYPEESHIYSYTATTKQYHLNEAGKYKLGMGKVVLKSEVTREEHMISFGVLYLGDHHIFGGVREFNNDQAFAEMRTEMEDAFNKSNVHEIIILLDKHFGTHNYSFWHLFKDDQKKILDKVLSHTSVAVEGMLRQLYENNYPILQAIKELNIPFPHPLKVPLEFVVNARLKRLIESDKLDFEELERIKEEVLRLSISLDSLTLDFIATERITSMMDSLFKNPFDIDLIKQVVRYLEVFKGLPLTLDLWRSENLAFIIRRIHYEGFLYKSEIGDVEAQRWIDLFNTLYTRLNLKM